MGEKETKASEGEAPIPGKPSKEQRTANEAGGAGGVTGLESESERMQSPSPRDMGSGMASEREVSGIGSASEGKTEGDPDFDSAQAIIKSKSNITNNREGSPGSAGLSGETDGGGQAIAIGDPGVNGNLADDGAPESAKIVTKTSSNIQNNREAANATGVDDLVADGN